MNALERDLLRRIADDDNLMALIGRTLLTSLDDKQLNLDELDDERLGQEVRGRERGKQLVEKGLNKIKELKTTKTKKENNNVAL